MKTRIVALLGLLLTVGVPSAGGTNLGTSFPYQGRLTVNGQPANGVYDLRFALFDAETDGNQVGDAVTNSAVSVDSGNFRTSVDFGADVFHGTAYWLEIAVRANGSGGGFTRLSARQAVSSVPYAQYTKNAGTAAFATTAATVADGAVGTIHIQDGAITADKLAMAQAVKSLNGLRDDVVLAAGTNVTLTTNGHQLILSATGSGGGPTTNNVVVDPRGVVTSPTNFWIANSSSILSLAPTNYGAHVWVDPVLGSDATGLRGNQGKPFRTIPSALRALRDGDVLSLQPGSYDCAPDLPRLSTPPDYGAALKLVGRTNVVVRGEGEGVLIRSSAAGNLWLVRDCLNITFENVECRGTGPDSTNYHALILTAGTNWNLHVDHCRFADYGDHAIAHLWGPRSTFNYWVSDCSFENGGCTFSPATGWADGSAVAIGGQGGMVLNNSGSNVVRGIEVEGSDSDGLPRSVIIRGNRFLGIRSNGSGAMLFPGATSEETYSTVIIDGNVFTAVLEATNTSGVVVLGGSRHRVIGNTLQGFTDGIILGSTGTPMNDAEISANTVTSFAGTGILLGQSLAGSLLTSKIRDNIVGLSGGIGVFVTGGANTVEGNTIHNVGTAIRVGVTSGATFDCSITDNYLVAATTGIAIDADVSRTIVQNNRQYALGVPLADAGTLTRKTQPFSDQFYLQEGGGALLALGPINDGGYLRRRGTNIVSELPPSEGLAVTTVSTGVTLGNQHRVVLANPQGQSIVVALPSAVGLGGRTYTLKRLNAGAAVVSLSAATGETVDGAAVYRLTSQYQSVTVISDGGNWMIIGR